jgi:hypothetical protein
LAAGEVNAQARQEFLRIAEKLEAEALAEAPGELKPADDRRTVIEGGQVNHSAAGRETDGSEVQERSYKKRRGKKTG